MKYFLAVNLLVISPLALHASGPSTFTLDKAQLAAITVVNVAASEDGRLVESAISQGDRVRADQVLGRLEDDEAKLGLEKARMELEIARQIAESDTKLRLAAKTLAVTKAAEQRALDSVAKYPKSVTQSRLDELRLRVEEAELKVEQELLEHRTAKASLKLKENAVRMAEAKHRRRQITTLAAGEVVEVLVEPGAWVKAGDTVFRILNRDRLRVEGFLKIEEAVTFPRGTPVSVRIEVIGQGPQSFPGVVSYVSPELDPQLRHVQFRIELENRDGKLFPGQSGSVLIERRPATKSNADGGR